MWGFTVSTKTFTVHRLYEWVFYTILDSRHYVKAL